MRLLRIGLAQINCTVGDLEGNAKKIISYIHSAREKKIDLIVFPELSITGYPPEDLLLKPGFITDNIKMLKEIAGHVEDLSAIVGFVDRNEDIYNAAAVIDNRDIVSVVHKILLPYYGVFDENRYFMRGRRSKIHTIKGIRVGVSICEDIWHPDGPVILQARAGLAELIVNISASPYHHGKGIYRERMLSGRAQDNSAVVAYTNMVGGQDELIFDGGSTIFDFKGDLLARGKVFEEDLVICDIDFDLLLKNRLLYTRNRIEIFTEEARESIDNCFVSSYSHSEALEKPKFKAIIEPSYGSMEEIYKALTLGVKDYFAKNRFKKAVIGLSGGIDSALCTTIAVDALGKENVNVVFMPSQYTSEESRLDMTELVDNLGISLYTVPINRLFDEYRKSMKELFEGKEEDKTEENIQARIRGNIMMALSNKFGWIVLTTGNKSEMSVGYATLYGDMAGGFAVIKDIYKTMVFNLCIYKNKATKKKIIPQNIMDKPPSAELRPNQTDQDTLPPYDLLDEILKLYIEEDMTANEIIEYGLNHEIVSAVTSMVDRSEYKRRQAPLGIKITQKAFGKDRRFPISNRYGVNPD